MKLLAYSISIIVVLGCFVDVNAQSTGRLKKVVIDAGHGGKDPGARGRYTKEKDIVLAVALKLGNYIEKYLPEVEVVYTRKKDEFIPLMKRAEIANKSKAELFISIHANYISNPRVRGTETFALGLHRTQDNLEVAKKENSVILLEDDYSTTFQGFDPNSSESYIIFELYQNMYLDQSLEMASLIENQFKQRVGRNSRGVKQAGFLVLRETAMPGVLVELGFLSNSNEEKYMSSNEGQSLLASGLFRAFRAYKKNFDEKNKFDMPKEQMKTAKNNTQITYRIQVASSKRKIKEGASIYRKLDDVYEYKDGELYKYATGECKSFSEISKMMPQLRKKFKDCFVIAFENDKRIPLSDARAKSGD
ncbi:N-acetylmuramoyl-L-alanine amidase [Saccharicrinis carchari]|uniref:N-acetylmuramoyl-L-alanine amidase n=1 Tax=Saccharicrinis carchari TaxID=1168039 RepID=A0A521AT14_SACCC|nr:N-acetylmuramoyl-L-alanine amidase [Saccharicrinis carchari]SMO37945.1 N-acetylmuramoyl-L-alanine amidase [Saccharicrinis carchari]